jgi:hypothetical protein
VYQCEDERREVRCTLSAVDLKNGHKNFRGIIEKNNLRGRNQLEDLGG